MNEATLILKSLKHIGRLSSEFHQSKQAKNRLNNVNLFLYSFFFIFVIIKNNIHLLMDYLYGGVLN